MKAYFFIITPVNYLSALQASRDTRFSFLEKKLIVLSDYHRSLSQFNSIVNPEDWDSVTYPWLNMDRRNKSKLQLMLYNLKKRFIFRNIFKEIKEDDYIFWGNMNHKFFQKIPSRNESIYLLDDGFSTINILQRLEKAETKRNLHLYTLFSLKSNEVSILNHQFDLVKPEIQVLDLEKKVFFIGQPLVFNKIVSEKYYVQSIDSIFQYYENNGFDCFYLPHRSTTRNYIPANWKVIDLNFPLEYCTEKGEINPGIFVTFYSTGVYNLGKYLTLAKNQTIFWELDKNEINSNFINQINPIYSYLKQNGWLIKSLNSVNNENIDVRHNESEEWQLS